MLPPTERLLFKELLRGCRTLERLQRRAPASPLVSATVLRFVNDHAPHALPEDGGGAARPSDAVRRCFREPPPDAVEVAFGALRTVGKVTAWLAINERLHDLSAQGAAVEEGAFTIAEAIEQHEPIDHAPAAPTVEVCGAMLDGLAADVRRRIIDSGDDGETPSRLRTLVHINASLFEAADGGFSGVLPRAGPAHEVDVASGSSLPRVLGSRRGLPIVLCTVYAAVA
eukprot:4779773-Prymnesium_polylepis.1